MSVRINNTRTALRKNAGVLENLGSSVAKFTKENPDLTRALALGGATALAGGLGAKLLGSDNAALWGLGLGSLVGGGDYFLNKNPQYVPEALTQFYNDPVAAAREKLSSDKNYRERFLSNRDKQAEASRRIDRRLAGTLGGAAPSSWVDAAKANPMQHLRDAQEKRTAEAGDKYVSEAEKSGRASAHDRDVRYARLLNGYTQLRNQLSKHKLSGSDKTLLDVMSPAERELFDKTYTPDETLDLISGLTDASGNNPVLNAIKLQRTQEILSGGKNTAKFMDMMDAAVNAAKRNKAAVDLARIRSMKPSDVAVNNIEVVPRAGETYDEAETRLRASAARTRYQQMLQDALGRLKRYSR